MFLTGLRKYNYKRPLTVNRVEVKGTCCVKIFERSRFRGKSQMLNVGFDDAPNFRKIGSVMFRVCIWYLIFQWNKWPSNLTKNNSILTSPNKYIVQSISISISTIYGTECNENIGSIILKIRYFITDNWDEKCAKIWLFLL